MLNANFKPVSKWLFSFTGAYTNSRAEMDTITFDEINEQLGFDPETNGMSQYDYDFEEVHNYSDLQIEQWDLTLGASYQLTAKALISAGISYMSYDEDEKYLADESGSAYTGIVNLAYWFK